MAHDDHEGAGRQLARGGFEGARIAAGVRTAAQAGRQIVIGRWDIAWRKNEQRTKPPLVVSISLTYSQSPSTMD